MADQPNPTRSPGELARRLIRAADRASLASIQRDSDSWPYCSLVLNACALDASPILHLSDLAEHGKNLKRDPRMSLLYDGTGGLDQPLTGARVTVMGRAVPTTGDGDIARYLARHPSAKDYAGFADFHFYRVEVARAHLVAGFGRIHWIEPTDLLAAPAPALGEAEAGIIEHMNQDHAGALGLYARNLLGRQGEGWQMTGIDAEGLDLRAGGSVARLWFERPVLGAEDARAELVRLAKLARHTGPAR